MSSLKKSPWVIHYDGSSCNGCDIETVACLMPVYDVERLGIINVGNPKHADVLLITGAVNEKNKEVVRNLYQQMPDPKVVVAIGICATSGCIFAECYNVGGGVDEVIPVDVYVPGCAARPEAIIDGIARSLEILEEKNEELKAMETGAHLITIETAEKWDAKDIFDLQELVHKSEEEIYTDRSVPLLTQSLEEIEKDLGEMTFFKAMMNNRVVGTVRAYEKGDNCCISRLMVNPLYQHHGIGRRLVEHAEKHFHKAKRFEVSVYTESRRNIVFFQGLGFSISKREKDPVGMEKVYMQK